MRQSRVKKDFTRPNQFKEDSQVFNGVGDLLTITNDVNGSDQNCVGYEVMNERNGKLFYISNEDYNLLTKPLRA